MTVMTVPSRPRAPMYMIRGRFIVGSNVVIRYLVQKGRVPLLFNGFSLLPLTKPILELCIQISSSFIFESILLKSIHDKLL